MDDSKKFPELNAPQYNWDTNQVSFNTDPLVDTKRSGNAILRMFTFKFNPALKKKPTKQELFNFSWKQCRDMLWRDGLRPREDIAPKVSVSKTGYTVYITAEPRMGVTVTDTPRTLEDVMGLIHK